MFPTSLSLRTPIFQAPMAGISTPALAAAVSEAGGLGALGLGASSVEVAREAIKATRARTTRPFAVNFFCHTPPPRDQQVEKAWLARLQPHFARLEAQTPEGLEEIYQPLRAGSEMADMVLEEAPAVVSFHFGLPQPQLLKALRARGCLTLASATSLHEAQTIMGAGLDGVIVQGWEAGGHRGSFDPQAPDERLPMRPLLAKIRANLPETPLVAAGGLSNGADIAEMLALGAQAAQLGTAFLACPESATGPAHRELLTTENATTTMTAAISGRMARCLVNEFTALGEGAAPEEIPAYPLAYDAGKALNAAALKRGENGYGAQWAGTGHSSALTLPAAQIMARLEKQLGAAR